MLVAYNTSIVGISGKSRRPKKYFPGRYIPCSIKPSKPDKKSTIYYNGSLQIPHHAIHLRPIRRELRRRALRPLPANSNPQTQSTQSKTQTTPKETKTNTRKVCLIHHPTNTTNEWLLPKGRRNRGESRTDAALRKLREETGFRRCQSPCPRGLLRKRRRRSLTRNMMLRIRQGSIRIWLSLLR